MAFGPSRIYGFDIETDTSGGGGLDPATARVTENAVAVGDGGEVFAHADEATMFADLAGYLETLPPGLIVTWNGSVFDLPFVNDRRALHPTLVRDPRGFVLTPDPEVVPKYEPLPGHAGGYSGVWQQERGTVHQHLDIAFAYRKVADDLGVKWSLKPVARALGLDPVELDREHIHRYTPEERRVYALSDAAVSRQLALRLLGL